jgi:hypothetical protein
MTSGGSISLTVIGKLQEPELPLPSIALQVTVVTPLGKTVPGGGSQDLLKEAAGVQLSVAFGTV